MVSGVGTSMQKALNDPIIYVKDYRNIAVVLPLNMEHTCKPSCV